MALTIQMTDDESVDPEDSVVQSVEYPNQTFAAFIAAGSKMENDQRIVMLPGKIIGIIGTIELDEGKPEIEVTSLDQIRG